MIYEKITKEMEDIVCTKFVVALYSALLKQGIPLDKANEIASDTSYVYYENKKKGYKESLCWLMGLHNDDGRYKNGWWSMPKPPKKVRDYNDLYNFVKSIKYRMCKKLNLSYNSTFNDIINKVK